MGNVTKVTAHIPLSEKSGGGMSGQVRGGHKPQKMMNRNARKQNEEPVTEVTSATS